MAKATANSIDYFPLEIGQTIRRTELQKLIGGACQWGITSCLNGAEFLIFHNPVKSKKFGYDVWEGQQPDGSFAYTGQGVKGPQKLTFNNKKLIEAYEMGKPLRLFRSSGTNTTYLGRMTLGEPTFSWKMAPDGEGETRPVIVFNLVPSGDL